MTELYHCVKCRDFHEWDEQGRIDFCFRYKPFIYGEKEKNIVRNLGIDLMIKQLSKENRDE